MWITLREHFVNWVSNLEQNMNIPPITCELELELNTLKSMVSKQIDLIYSSFVMHQKPYFLQMFNVRPFE